MLNYLYVFRGKDQLYESQKKEYVKLFRELAKKNQIIKNLATISGIDIILAVIIFAAVIDAKRFSDKYKYFSLI